MGKAGSYGSAGGPGMEPYMKLLGQNSPTYQKYASQDTKDFWAQNPGGAKPADVYQGLADRTAKINASKPQAPRPQGGASPFGGQASGMHNQLSYQTGFNADRVAVNSGDVLGRLGQEGQYLPQQGSATGIQAAADLSKSLAMNDQAQMRRGIEKANAQQSMNDKVTRSELMQSGLSNQAKIYGDMAQRQTSQIGLAAQLQESMIRNRFALAQALLGNS